MKAVIPSAGLGTRFLPATKDVPKELLPVLDKPVIQRVVEEALAVDAVDAVVIVNSREKPSIEAYFSPAPKLEEHLRTHGKGALADSVHAAGELPVAFVYQDEPLGLGHAVLQAAPETGDDRFLLLLGDYFVPSHEVCKQLVEVSEAHGGASVIAVAPVPHDQVGRYGIVAGDLVGGLHGDPIDEEEPGAVLKLTGLVEKPKPEEAPTNLFIVGRYLLTSRVMELLKSQTPGAGGEIQITDSLERLLADEEAYALVINPAEGCDTGTPAAWAGTNARMALADPAQRAAFLEALGPAVAALR